MLERSVTTVILEVTTRTIEVVGTVKSAVVISSIIVVESSVLVSTVHIIIIILTVLVVIVVVVTVLHRTAIIIILIIVAVLILARGLTLFSIQRASIQQIVILIIIMSIIILRASAHGLLLLLLLVHISIETFSLLISLHVIACITDIIGAKSLGVGLKLSLSVFTSFSVLFSGAAADVVKKSGLFIFLDVDGRLKFLELLI